MEHKLTHAQKVNKYGTLIMKQCFACENGSNYYLRFKYYEGDVYMIKVKDAKLVQCNNLTKEGKRAYKLRTTNSIPWIRPL